MEVGTLELKSSQRKDPFLSLSLFLHLSLDLPFHHLLIHFEQCDQIWQNFKSLWAILVWFILYLASYYTYCDNFLCHGANFHRHKWPKIEK